MAVTGGGSPLLEVSDPTRGSLTVAEGGRVVLLGGSGAGKTRWLKGLLGLGEPTMSSVRVSGKKCKLDELRRTVGWVPDGGGVFLDLTVWENVARPPHLPPVPQADAMEALEIVALSPRLREPVSKLPLTERRRVALARAIARRSPLVIVDGDLDATLKPLLLALLEQAPGLRGLILTSAAADDAAWNADSVALVAGGRVVQQAPWAELLLSQQPDVRGARLWVEQ